MSEALKELDVNPLIDILFKPEEEPIWVFPGVMLQGQIVIYAGEEGVGKSYVSYVLAIAAACGIAPLGKAIPAPEPMKVLYFDEENSPQDHAKYVRRAWFGLMHGREPEEVRRLEDLAAENFWPLSGHLGSEEWPDTVAMAYEMFAPKLAIFDTANPCFAIEEENNNGVAETAVRHLRKLRKLTMPEVTQIIIKHAKIRMQRGRRRIRGAKAWAGAADQVMFQVKGVGRQRADGLSLTRLEPDKTRAYGLRSTLYITPRWIDKEQSGLILDGSYTASKEHKNKEQEEDEMLDGKDGDE